MKCSKLEVSSAERVGGVVLLIQEMEIQSMMVLPKKKMHNLRVGVKFYLGQNEDCSLGGRTSDSSERLLQRGSERKVNI